MKKLFLFLLSSFVLLPLRAELSFPERKALAEKGDIIEQFEVGVCYAKGEGVAQDYQKAVYWWKKAAEQGVAYAQFGLGNCYYYGEGIAKNRKQAVYWWKKAAEQGNFWAKIFLFLSK